MKNTFASVEDLQTFTGVYPEEANNQQVIYLQAATDIITNYLGYDPIKSIRKESLKGKGDNYIFLNSRPVNKIINLTINDEVISPEVVSLGESSISLNNGFFYKGCKINIEYDAGWEKLPELIRLTTLRIAALFQTEANDNIGITSKSFGDSGSRTFYNFTNFSKYLSQLSSYQIY